MLSKRFYWSMPTFLGHSGKAMVLLIYSIVDKEFVVLATFLDSRVHKPILVTAKQQLYYKTGVPCANFAILKATSDHYLIYGCGRTPQAKANQLRFAATILIHLGLLRDARPLEETTISDNLDTYTCVQNPICVTANQSLYNRS
jgi:hypothetical protein